jgi:hypothetical protein
VNFSHQLLRKRRQGSRMSRVGEIRDQESKSGLRMRKGLLVAELFSKNYFVDVVVASGCGYVCPSFVGLLGVGWHIECTLVLAVPLWCPSS